VAKKHSTSRPRPRKQSLLLRPPSNVMRAVDTVAFDKRRGVA
jgi:hypothetical protein